MFLLASETLKMAPVAKPRNRNIYSSAKICELAKSFYFHETEFLDKLSGKRIDLQLDDADTDKISPSEYWSRSAT